MHILKTPLIFSLLCLLVSFGITSTHAKFKASCYEYYSKIGPGIALGEETYIISSDKTVGAVLQDGKNIALKSYKENISFNGGDSEFNKLNDDNKRTFIEVDTHVKKELYLELSELTSAGSFRFKMDIDSKFHNTLLYISEDGTDYSKVSVYNIEDFSFKYLKLQFQEGKQNIREKIKIRELSFKNKNRSYLINSKSSGNIEFYSGYMCNNDEPQHIHNETDFPIDIDTGTIDVEFFKNPKMDIYEGVDTDNDWIEDSVDNCLGIYNPKQEDQDGNGIGDACNDDDLDGIIGYYDNCPYLSNINQEDVNQNGVGDVCEFDKDEDGVSDAIDNCINIKNPEQGDKDHDNIGDMCDNCSAYNPAQRDTNENSVGDVCEKIEKELQENDEDKDRIDDRKDNCKKMANPKQLDTDKDGIGDMCDNCPSIQNIKQEDINKNSIGDMCEDIDSDGFIGYKDNCIGIANSKQEDSDNDGIGNVCEDDDGDTIIYLDDNCPHVYNKNQKDIDSDGIGDKCDDSDNRFLESNKYFFIFTLVIAATIFSVSIFRLTRKLQNNSPNK